MHVRDKDRLKSVCNAFVDRQGLQARHGLFFKRAPSERKEVVLPYDSVRASLARHQLVQDLRLDPLTVYNALKQVLVTEEDQGRSEQDQSGGESPTTPLPVPVPVPGQVRGQCDFCDDAHAMLDEDRAGGFNVCSNCGTCDSSLIDYTNPYRSLEGKEDRRHFESLEVPREPWPEVEHYGILMHLPRGTIDEARALLCRLARRQRIAVTSAACVAAIIAATCPNILATHEVHAPVVPRADYQCPECSAGVHSWLEARVHCTLGGTSKGQKPIDRCRVPRD